MYNDVTLDMTLIVTLAAFRRQKTCLTSALSIIKFRTLLLLLAIDATIPDLEQKMHVWRSKIHVWRAKHRISALITEIALNSHS